ncbi:Uncharacterised protein [Mycobacteroides abscessus]|nr:Uncharacterised protein [Mycobacteroides abscessus]
MIELACQYGEFDVRYRAAAVAGGGRRLRGIPPRRCCAASDPIRGQSACTQAGDGDRGAGGSALRTRRGVYRQGRPAAGACPAHLGRTRRRGRRFGGRPGTHSGFGCHRTWRGLDLAEHHLGPAKQSSGLVGACAFRSQSLSRRIRGPGNHGPCGHPGRIGPGSRQCGGHRSAAVGCRAWLQTESH